MTEASTLAITWIDHRRIREICAALGVPLVVLITPLPRILRYALLSWRTWVLLLRTRPGVVIAQNPSLGLAVLCAALAPVFGFALVIDAHNEGVVPFIYDVWLTRRIARILHRRCSLTIVTNRQLQEVVERNGGTAFVLPDKIPAVEQGKTAQKIDELRIAVISTFTADEPFDRIVSAAGSSPVHWRYLVTGDPARVPAALRAKMPANLQLTGFLPEAEYWNLLRSAHVALDLTDCKNCLVCGAYEALAVGRPMVLTKDEAAIELFDDAAAFCDNSPADILAALRRIEAHWSHYRDATVVVRNRLEIQWQALASLLMQAVSKLDRAC